LITFSFYKKVNFALVAQIRHFSVIPFQAIIRLQLQIFSSNGHQSEMKKYVHINVQPLFNIVNLSRSTSRFLLGLSVYDYPRDIKRA